MGDDPNFEELGTGGSARETGRGRGRSNAALVSDKARHITGQTC